MGDPVLVTGDLLALALDFALEAAPIWSAAFEGNAAERAVSAFQACLRCPCALHADAARLATACLHAPWVGGRPVDGGAPRARDAALVLRSAAGFAETHARAVLGESPDARVLPSDVERLLYVADNLLGGARGSERGRAVLASRLLGRCEEEFPSAREDSAANVPERPPINGVLAGLQTDLRWARDRLATFLNVRQTDPAQAEEELRYLTGDLRDATEGVAELLRVVATWDELKRRARQDPAPEQARTSCSGAVPPMD